MTKKIFKTRYFARWMRKTDLSNDLLNFSATELKSEIKNNTLQEICYDNEA
jgi:hypothetical protein